ASCAGRASATPFVILAASCYRNAVPLQELFHEVNGSWLPRFVGDRRRFQIRGARNSRRVERRRRQAGGFLQIVPRRRVSPAPVVGDALGRPSLRRSTR